MRSLNSRSDNWKSKTCGERGRTIKNPKWLGPSIMAFVLVVAGVSGQVQPAEKIPRIGYVSTSGDLSTPGFQVEAFRQGLRDLSYVESKNIAVEYRYIEGEIDRTPALVAELVRLKVDVLVVTGLTPVRAAKETTKTIPIVMVTTQDPVAMGLIESLARPGGNITGLTTLTRDLSGKRLELLKEIVPKMPRVAVLWNTDEPGAAIALKEYEAVARALKMELQSLGVRVPNPDFDGAFQAAAKERSSALITITGTLLSRNAKPIADLAIKNRLPSMYERNQYVEAGGLMSYSSDNYESFRRAAIYVDKILKGAKPGDLPVEQPTKFEFVINLKTAKQIGLTIPQSVLFRADRVIR
jgi:putative ABC transport system substrate-binding protein